MTTDLATKPLEWGESPIVGTICAEGPRHLYKLYPLEGGFILSIYTQPGDWKFASKHYFNNELCAKASAQAHHDARVREWLVGGPDGQSPLRTLREFTRYEICDLVGTDVRYRNSIVGIAGWASDCVMFGRPGKYVCPTESISTGGAFEEFTFLDGRRFGVEEPV